MPHPDDVVDALRALLAEDEALTERLLASLARARERGEEGLRPDLFAALD
ncbi:MULTISPECIES: hypothetical protein [unclassified Nocardioides]|nr:MULTISPECIES: hypothetical protein [unclassified Nocardioides]MDF9714670.1 hypothetical protein [Nocardioides sp. ChNu-99]